MAFDANDLTPHEHFVVERTRAGDVADFSAMAAPGQARPAIRAGFLRTLLLQINAAWTVRLTGVRVKGAEIQGALDLTDCSGAGGQGLPALELLACVITAPMDLSHARLARLSLRESAFSFIKGHDLVLDGPFDLAHVRPLADGGPCWIDARGAQIAGRVDGEGAHLVLESGLPKEAGAQKYALILREAKIKGGVCLRPDFRAKGGVSLFDAIVDGLVDMRGAVIKAVDRRAINLGNVRVSGVVSLSRGFRCEGPVWMRGAVLNGGLNLDGATIQVKDGEVEGVNAENCEIGEDLQMRSKFSANALVTFAGGQVRGSVRIDEASFSAQPVALDFSKAKISGDVSGGAHLTGGLSLDGAEIGRNLDLRGIEINCTQTRLGGGKTSSPVALNATSARIGAGALLQGANIKGETFLADARIDGYLAFGGGRFINPGHWAIRAPNARIGGNLTFKLAENGYAPHGQKTVIEGGAKFDRAQVDGSLAWAALELRGPGPETAKGGVLSLADAHVAGPIAAQGLMAQDGAKIILTGANCSALEDDIKAGWGPAGVELALDGFAYERLDSVEERAAQRLSWLKRARNHGSFSPQPFTQLARAYALAGRREDARRVLLAQHDLQTLHASASGPLTWILSSLFGVIAGYGLAPIRIARALIVYLAIGVAGGLAMNAQGALVRPDGSACNGAVEPALYAIDVALPVIDLGQESRCAPGRTARAELSPGIELGGSDWRIFEGAAVWKWAHALYAMVGAILTALAVLTFSGAMKPRND